MEFKNVRKIANTQNKQTHYSMSQKSKQKDTNNESNKTHSPIDTSCKRQKKKKHLWLVNLYSKRFHRQKKKRKTFPSLLCFHVYICKTQQQKKSKSKSKLDSFPTKKLSVIHYHSLRHNNQHPEKKNIIPFIITPHTQTHTHTSPQTTPNKNKHKQTDHNQTYRQETFDP